MNNLPLITFAVLSAATNTIGLLPYIRDILRKKTKPERATWWIWSALSLIALSAQISIGATWSLAMTVAQFTSVIFIAVLSIKYGYGRFMRRDYISLLVAFFGIILWVLTDNPVLALLIVISLDILALYLTIIKTWKDPSTETLISWVLATLSGAFGILAVGAFIGSELLYPFYITLGNGSLAFVIYYRRKKLGVQACLK